MSTKTPHGVMYDSIEEASRAHMDMLNRCALSQETSQSRQEGGDHYTTLDVQPWDAMQAWMTHDQFLGYLRGNIIKYVARCDKKGGLEDLRKAEHYLQKLIEVYRGNS